MKNYIILPTFLLILMLGCGSSDNHSNVANITNRLSLDMITKATEKSTEIDTEAFIIWVGGRRIDGQPMSAPSETDDWQFIADTGSSALGAWILHYNGEWDVTDFPCDIFGICSPDGIVLTDLSDVTMDVSDAWFLVKQAGYNVTFQSWELFQAFHADCENPFYVFVTGEGYFIFVDTFSGEVSEENDHTPLFDAIQ